VYMSSGDRVNAPSSSSFCLWYPLVQQADIAPNRPSDDEDWKRSVSERGAKILTGTFAWLGEEVPRGVTPSPPPTHARL
jgi:hypothetical protein